MLCLNCGQTARPESARCGQCNYKLPQDPHPPAGPASAMIDCWNCAQANLPDADRCSQCNAKLGAQVGKPNAGKRFPFTQHAVSHDE